MLTNMMRRLFVVYLSVTHMSAPFSCVKLFKETKYSGSLEPPVSVTLSELISVHSLGFEKDHGWSLYG